MSIPSQQQQQSTTFPNRNSINNNNSNNVNVNEAIAYEQEVFSRVFFMIGILVLSSMLMY